MIRKRLQFLSHFSSFAVVALAATATLAFLNFQDRAQNNALIQKQAELLSIKEYLNQMESSMLMARLDEGKGNQIQDASKSSDSSEFTAHLNRARQIAHDLLEICQESKYEKIVDSLEKFLVIAKNILGNNHFEVATNTSTLATLYYYDKKYDKAESLFHEALNIFDNLSIKDHPDIADTRHNLGMVYYDQNKYDRAEPLLLQGLESKKRFNSSIKFSSHSAEQSYH